MRSEPAQAVALIALAVAALFVVALLILAAALEAPRRIQFRAMSPNAPLKAISDSVGDVRIADYVAHEKIQERVDSIIAAESDRLGCRSGAEPARPDGATS